MKSSSRKDEAIERCAQDLPDIVLMDIRLGPGMDGIEAARQVRRQLDVPVIFLTAFSDGETIGRAKEVEPFGYILKPYDDKDLQTAIEIGMYRHRMQRKMRENEQWLAATLSSIGDAVVATDAHGQIRLMNGEAARLSGWNVEEAMGRHVLEVLNLIEEQSG